jgi:hypothetical protein
MRRAGLCLAIAWTKVEPRPPRVTPVVRMILREMEGVRSWAMVEAREVVRV